MRHRSMLCLFAFTACLAAACSKEDSKPLPNPKQPPAPTAQPTSEASLVKRGEFLVGIGGCNDCHTPMKFDPALGMPVPQMERRLSGHPEGGPDPSATPGNGDQAVIGPTFTAFRLPFGVVYASNLTPDDATGLGLWKEEDFVRAMRTGKHRGAESGRPILPPMPWSNISAHLSDDDLKAMFAYLKSVPALKNSVPEPNVPPPVYAAVAESHEKLAARAKSAPRQH
ncbi:MAG: diheme cytochrome c-553 [Myxococcales bacterium]|nr:diheme cytochrome c-553 [Myxococcales bacterium]